MNWCDGYPGQFGYVYEYQAELSPAHMRFALAHMGFAAPPANEGFSYCELGFGQGVTLNVLAAAYPGGSFVGNDFNPEHVRFARTLQQATGADLATYEDSFEAFAQRDLPPFDYIVAHGVWSWVSEAQRAHLVRFVREHLAPGGVFYVSYNAMPGWARHAPLRELVHATAGLAQGPGAEPAEALRGALDQVALLRNLPSGYFALNPQVAERFDQVRQQNPHYLAHEYLNDHWSPSYHHEVCVRLREAKLSFACAGMLAQQLGFLEIDPATQAVLDRVEPPMLRETYRDFLCNRQFRRDLYVKGPQRLSQGERRETLLQSAVALTTPAGQVQLRLEAPVGTGILDEALYGRLLERLSRDLERSVTLAELLEDRHLQPYGFDSLLQAVMVLAVKGDLALAPEGTPRFDQFALDRLNAWILEQATRNLGLPLLVDPVTCAARTVPHADQLFLDAIVQGVVDEYELVDHVERHLVLTGRRLADAEGRALDTPALRRPWLAERLRVLREGPLQLLERRGMIRTIGSHAERLPADDAPLSLRVH